MSDHVLPQSQPENSQPEGLALERIRRPRFDVAVLLDRLGELGLEKLARQRELTGAEAGLLALLTVFPDRSERDGEIRDNLEERRRAENDRLHVHTYQIGVG